MQVADYTGPAREGIVLDSAGYTRARNGPAIPSRNSAGNGERGEPAPPGALHRGANGGEPDHVQRVNLLGVGVMPTNIPDAVATLERWRDEGRREYVCCVCVDGVATAQRDEEVRRALNRSGLAVPDGMPLVWWSRASGLRGTRRVTAADLLDAMCALGVERRRRHFFYGASPEVLERMVARLRSRFPGLIVAGYRSPPFRALTEEEDAADVAAINEARSDYVWVGLGMPKQEKWMASHVGRISATALIGIGAAFDFSAGTKPRAPLWMQCSGLEWLFRLITEPRRLARRYLIGNAIFLVLALQQALGFRSYAKDW